LAGTNKNEGMLLIPKTDASSCSASVSTLKTLILPSKSMASSSRTGATTLHGPHQSA